MAQANADEPREAAAYEAGFRAGHKKGREEGIAKGYAMGVNEARACLAKLPTRKELSSFPATLITDLNFSARTTHCLTREGIQTVGDLTGKSEVELLDIRNFGQKSLDEVVKRLNEDGYALRDA